MASIIKRKYKGKKGDTVKYYITYRDIYGKQHTVGGYSGLQDAKKHLKDFEDGTCSRTDITIKDIFDLYAEKLKKKAHTTQYDFNMYYNKYFKEIEHLYYRKTDIIFWQKFFDNIESNSKYVAALCLRFAKAAANNAINKNIIDINKFTKIDKIEIQKPDINHLTKDELKLLLTTAKEKFSYKYYVCLYVFIATGMREGEIFALNKSDIDFEQATINVNKQFTKQRLKYKPKTSSSIRSVSIISDLLEVLKEYIKTVKGEILFPNNVGNYLNITNFRQRFWLKLLEACNITKRVRLHDLRGSYIDMVLSSGLSPKFAQNQVGHANIQTTLDVYAQNNQDMIEVANNKINDIFTSCCRNVVEKQNERPTNILQFPKRQAI